MGEQGRGREANATVTATAVSRRHALRILALTAGAWTLGRPPAGWATVRGESATGAARAARSVHPDPRPGIDASSVLPRDQVAPHAAELYDQVRRIPHIVDGIRCQCGCADLPGMYSLLSCYGPSGMAQYCEVCSGEGRLAYQLHTEGRSLDEIRAAVDRRFG